MNFGEAVEQLKSGKRVARMGWNGKGMFLLIAYQTSDDDTKSASVEFNQTVRCGDVSIKSLENFIVMKTAQNTLIPWLASQADILSEDWGVVPEIGGGIIL